MPRREKIEHNEVGSGRFFFKDMEGGGEIKTW